MRRMLLAAGAAGVLFLLMGIAQRLDAEADEPGQGAVLNGDANCDGEIDISDAVTILLHLFRGGPAPCPLAEVSDLAAEVESLQGELASANAALADAQAEIQRLETELGDAQASLVACHDSLAVCEADLLDCQGPVISEDPIDGYARISEGEMLTPQFNIAGGETTQSSYSGLVEIFVEGYGQDNVSTNVFQDAFWWFTGGNNCPGTQEQFLTIGSETQILPSPGGWPFSPNTCLGMHGAIAPCQLAVAYQNRSYYLDGGLRPEYNPGHVYHFVIDLRDYQGTLTLGFTDGGTWDNSSDVFVIKVWQVVAADSPED
ncbi:MAG: hypothetical protein JXA90_10500 [Planctomycetes bacterium]|nr:hypothetical protein [Planctomycetota bacterium]